MGLLKNIVSSTVNNQIRRGIDNGIRKGVGNAIGKAVEQAVMPTAERLANKSAKVIDQAANELNKNLSDAEKSMAEAGTAMKGAVAGMNEAAANLNEATAAMNGAAANPQMKSSLGGFVGLESAFSGLAARAEAYATQVSASIKVCPSCGEASPADKTFCPHCGAKLPETTLAHDYTCTKCGAVNTPGTKFCTKCGALLPGAEAEVKAQQTKDEAVLAKVKATLPMYPEWAAGGKEFSFEENGTQNGYPVYCLRFTGGWQQLNAYISQLRQADFYQTGDGYWKTIDGVCRAFDTTDAVCDGAVTVNFYVGTFDKKNDPKPAQDPLADLKGAAKGLFKKVYRLRAK